MLRRILILYLIIVQLHVFVLAQSAPVNPAPSRVMSQTIQTRDFHGNDRQFLWARRVLSEFPQRGRKGMQPGRRRQLLIGFA